MAILKLIFINLANALQHLVQLYCTEFNQTCTRNVERMDSYSLMHPSKAWLPVHRFLTKLITTQQHYVKIFCTGFHPNQSRNTNVQVYINLDPSVKYDYHEADSCQTHACSTTSSKLKENRAVQPLILGHRQVWYPPKEFFFYCMKIA